MAIIPTNKEIAGVFRSIAEYLAMENIPWRPRAYERAAETIETLDRSLADTYNQGGKKALEAVPGVGESIAGKIIELLTTGNLAYYQKLKKKTPVALDELTRVEGLGPKTIKLFWQKLKIKNLSDLETAARAGRLRNLPRFGEKAEEKLLRSIEFLKKSRGRFLLSEIEPLARELLTALKAEKSVEQALIAGSYRRRQETIGDIDVLATSSEPGKAIRAFCRARPVREIVSRGETKANVRLAAGIEADLRVLPEKSFGAALQYFTGDKNHNVALRKIAIAKGMKLSEYGLFKKQKFIAGKTEEDIYAALGLDWIPPELRTARGEIKAAAAHRLPKIIPYGSLKGDLQIQTSWTDGSVSIAEMAAAAKKIGLEYLAVTDHTKSLAMAHGLDEKRLVKQGTEIEALNKRLSKFRILKSAEVNVDKNGLLDIADSALKKLDLVCVAVHSHFDLDKKTMTERIIRALKNPLVNILFHPTGRLIGRREPYQIDMLKLLRAAKQFGVALEVNGSPERLDISDNLIREAIKLGVKLVINSDAHSPDHFRWLELGVAQARRGWATKKEVLNTLPLNDFLAAIKSLKKR
jgi:DNA polymerase (family 10)